MKSHTPNSHKNYRTKTRNEMVLEFQSSHLRSYELVELAQKVKKLQQHSKNEEGLEEKIVRKFHQPSGTTNLETLEECLKYCLQQYSEKENQLTDSLEMAVQLHRVANHMVELSAEVARKLSQAEEQIEIHIVQFKKLEDENHDLHQQVIRLRSNTDYLAIEYENQKYNRDQMIKQGLRETYESDKQEIDRMGEVLRILQKDLEKKTNKIIQYEQERARTQNQLKENQQLMDDLLYQNKKLRNQIQRLSCRLQNPNQAPIDIKKSENQLIDAILSVTENPILQPECKFQKTTLNQLEAVLSPEPGRELEAALERKLNCKSAENIRNALGIVQDRRNEKQLVTRYKQKSAEKRKSIKKMKSMAIRPYYKQHYKHQDIKLFPLKAETDQQKGQPIEKNRQDLGQIILANEIRIEEREQRKKEKCLYKVKSIERFSEFSEANRLSGAFYNNLRQECNNGYQIEQKGKQMKSIGLMTEPSEEQQFINNKDLDSPIQSPYKRIPPSTPPLFQQNKLHRSCIINQAKQQPDVFISNKSLHNPTQLISSSTNPKTQNMISRLFSTLVSKRTHKKVPKISIAQIEDKKNSNDRSRKQISKSYIHAFNQISKSFIGASLPSGKKQNCQEIEPKLNTQYLSMSMLDFGREQREGGSGMRKKNKAMIAPAFAQQRERKLTSTLFDSLFNFTVRNRIKK